MNAVHPIFSSLCASLGTPVADIKPTAETAKTPTALEVFRECAFKKDPFKDHNLAADHFIKAEADFKALIAAAEWAQMFITGFEGDELQDIDEDLEHLRAALANVQGGAR